MAVDQNFAAAWIDGAGDLEYAPTRLLGVRVRKFCLWHRLLLRVLQSPLMGSGERVDFFALRTAVGICRLRYGDCTIRRPWLVPALLTTKAVLASLLSFRRRVSPDEPNALQRAIAAQAEVILEHFGDYLQEPDASIIPHDLPKGATPQAPMGSAPAELEIACDIIGWAHWPEWKVWELPMGKANHYRTIALRTRGLLVDFHNEEQKAFEAQLPPEFKHTKD